MDHDGARCGPSQAPAASCRDRRRRLAGLRHARNIRAELLAAQTGSPKSATTFSRCTGPRRSVQTPFSLCTRARRSGQARFRQIRGLADFGGPRFRRNEPSPIPAGTFSGRLRALPRSALAMHRKVPRGFRRGHFSGAATPCTDLRRTFFKPNTGSPILAATFSRRSYPCTDWRGEIFRLGSPISATPWLRRRGAPRNPRGLFAAAEGSRDLGCGYFRSSGCSVKPAAKSRGQADHGRRLQQVDPVVELRTGPNVARARDVAARCRGSSHRPCGCRRSPNRRSPR